MFLNDRRVTVHRMRPQPKRPQSKRRRPTIVAALAVVGVLAPGAVAKAVPPTAADFQIRYFVTDENGDRGRAMTSQDLTQFFGRARCECAQLIEAQITLVSSSGQAFDPNQIRVFAGSNCSDGQLGNTSQNNPCVQLENQLPNFYTRAPSFTFPAIWLSSGVVGSDQSLGTAEPELSCDQGAGDGGIWICVEDGTQTDCQPEEFIVKGTQNINVPADQSGASGGSTGAIRFDYDPPLSTPTSFELAEGDGAVRVSWDSQSDPGVGYRVLCADANDEPLENKGISRPSVTAENQGTLYFTETNLCPEGPFDDTPEGDIDGEVGPDDGGTGDGGTDGDDRGTDGGTDDFGAWDSDPDEASGFWWDGGAHGGLPTGGDTGGDTGSESTTGADDSGTTTGGTTTGGTTTGGDATGGTTTGGTATDTGSTTGGRPSAGIESLDWDYVCSKHLGFNADSARIEGLENGAAYSFLVVAYDQAGNPIAVSEPQQATPRETTDLWEQCEAQGDLCGSGGFCHCSTDNRAPDGPLALLGLTVLAGIRRKRRSTRRTTRSSR